MQHASETSVAALQRLPMVIEHAMPGGSVLARALLLIPVLTLAAAPLTLIAAHAIAEPASFAALRHQPFLATQVAAGITLWTLLFVWPLQRMLFALGKSRSICVTEDRVSVVERGGLQRQRSWSEPLSSYRGIARRVRSTLSGVRYELVLVHRDRARHVILIGANSIPQPTVDQLSTLLGLPEVPTDELYPRAPRWRQPAALAATVAR
jgi:hypothetical protein